MSERRTVHLGQLYNFSSGLSKSRSAFGSGYPFLTFKDVFYNIFVPSELGDLVNSTEHERDVCSIKRGDVFLTRTSETMHELGMSCVALQDIDAATFNGFTKRLRPKVGVEIAPEYAGYFFRSDWFRRQITAMASLSTRASLNNEMLGRLQMILPDEIDQRAIGRVLKCLDDKIDLNRRMNETLEAITRAIFKSWFVDFDPVRAKLAGEQPVGLAPEIAALFPAALVESELGEMPVEWKVRTIGDLAEIVGGSTPSTTEPEYWEDGVHYWATPKDLSGLSMPVLLDTERRITNAGLARISSGLLPVGTVLLSSRAPIGYLTIAEIPVAINQGFIALKPKNIASNLFLLLWCSFALDEIVSRANGSTFLEISKSSFRPIPLVVPPPQVMGVFDRLVRPLYSRIVQNERETRNLATLRDTLLPKLISGELRVADAEQIVGRSL